MDVIAQNLANAETTRTPQGGPYHRRFTQLEAITPTAPVMTNVIAGLPVAVSRSPPTPRRRPPASRTRRGACRSLRLARTGRTGQWVYDPAHPDADKNGYVHMPNVRMSDELMDLMNARRLYEANATVFQVARTRCLHKAIDTPKEHHIMSIYGIEVPRPRASHAAASAARQRADADADPDSNAARTRAGGAADAAVGREPRRAAECSGRTAARDRPGAVECAVRRRARLLRQVGRDGSAGRTWPRCCCGMNAAQIPASPRRPSRREGLR